MGFKFINSREYKELCERIAFVEADLNEARRELDASKRMIERKDDIIKSLKNDIVRLDEEKREEVTLNSELKGQIAELETRLEMAKHQQKEYGAPTEKPVKKPRATRKTKKAE